MLVFLALGTAKVLSFALGDAKVPKARSFAFWWNIGFTLHYAYYQPSMHKYLFFAFYDIGNNFILTSPISARYLSPVTPRWKKSVLILQNKLSGVIHKSKAKKRQAKTACIFASISFET